MPYKNPPILNETDDPKLAHLDQLLRSVSDDQGAYIAVTLAPVDPKTGKSKGLNVSVKLADTTAAANVRSQLPAEYEPSVEGGTVLFTVPPEVVGKHGRIGTYTNHKCHGVLCQAKWRQQTQGLRAKRKRWLAAAPRVTLDDGRVVSYVVDDDGREQTVEHGDWGRSNWGCDCDICKSAHASYENKRRHSPANRKKKATTAAQDNAEIAKILG